MKFNAPFCIEEFDDALKNSNNTAVGLDYLSCEMLVISKL